MHFRNPTTKRASRCPEQGGTGIRCMPEQGGTGLRHSTPGITTRLASVLAIAIMPLANVVADDSIWEMRGEISGSAQLVEAGNGRVQLSLALPSAESSLEMHVAVGDRKNDHAVLDVHRLERIDGVSVLHAVGRMELFFSECGIDALIQFKSENEGSGGKSENEGSGGKSENEGSGGKSENEGSGGKSENEGSGGKSENEGSGGKSENEGSGGKHFGSESEHVFTLVSPAKTCADKSENEGSGTP